MLNNNKKWCLLVAGLMSSWVNAADLPVVPLGVTNDVALDGVRFLRSIRSACFVPLCVWILIQSELVWLKH